MYEYLTAYDRYKTRNLRAMRASTSPTAQEDTATTGWTGIVARAMHLFATTTAEQMLALGKLAPVIEIEPARALVGAR